MRVFVPFPYFMLSIYISSLFSFVIDKKDNTKEAPSHSLKKWRESQFIFRIENNLKIELNFNRFGQINIQGYFQEVAHQENILHYEFESEQSYLTSTLRQLNSIVDHYGDLKGKK